MIETENRPILPAPSCDEAPRETPPGLNPVDAPDVEVAATPLPKLQLFILLYLQLAEPITSTVIYPFVNQLVRETGITGGDERKTGYFAGLIESCFYAVEAVCVLQWGRASDHIGRKPVLLGGLLGLTLSMLGFGVSRAYWALVLSRCAEGALNGNIGVTKSMMAEITDHTNRVQAFAFFPMSWQVGGTLGPIIGGVFARPADRWPGFRESAFWKTYPYFLPCVIAASISISAFVLAAIGLKETLPRQPRKKHDVPAPAPTDIEKLNESTPGQSSTKAVEKDPAVAVNEVAVAVTDRDAPAVGFRSILVPRVLWAILNYAFLTLLDQSITVLVPLMYSTSIALGGLGFAPFTIGLVQGVGGCVGGLIQIFTFPWFHRTFGARKLYINTYVMYVMVFALFPLESFVTKRAGGVGAVTWALVVLQYAAYVVSYMSWGCVFLDISDAAPNQRALGLTNGLAQTTCSIIRAIGPSLASSLFSVTLEHHLAGGTLGYWVLVHSENSKPREHGPLKQYK
ncbi:MFS general substrate transporter [Trametes versicolor FP-101664 SS1]|uniref:MFS general substrate transporter n=1 Tax=Trametes versicolor (strain FP-101664) TaxID=717944 RepID=UPI00046239B5|nr:MFS general substrate transporter [Trametes versicolor FP-101664 SS1]EIW57761.1 MFS general substrate transporter [Trametes versicolor FP-101664 SS1]